MYIYWVYSWKVERWCSSTFAVIKMCLIGAAECTLFSKQSIQMYMKMWIHFICGGLNQCNRIVNVLNAYAVYLCVFSVIKEKCKKKSWENI